jgi:CRP/FNR family cyclic AMP-dependent transcriptional regulator
MSTTDLEVLANIPLFSDLSLEEINIIDQYLSTMEVQEGETIFNENDEGDFVCFVIKGTLDVLKKNISNELVSISHVNKDRAIGEMALVDQLKRSATVKAKSNVTLTLLTRKQFDLILEKHPHISNKILLYIARALSLNLRRTSNQLSDALEN